VLLVEIPLDDCFEIINTARLIRCLCEFVLSWNEYRLSCYVPELPGGHMAQFALCAAIKLSVLPYDGTVRYRSDTLEFVVRLHRAPISTGKPCPATQLGGVVTTTKTPSRSQTMICQLSMPPDTVPLHVSSEYARTSSRW
jgi:hypothetical protein